MARKKKVNSATLTTWFQNFSRWDNRPALSQFSVDYVDVPLSRRTPQSEASVALGWVEFFLTTAGFDDKIFESVMTTVIQYRLTGEAAMPLIKLAEESAIRNADTDTDGSKFSLVVLSIIHVICAHAYQAIAEKLNPSLAWANACEANRWVGVLQGTYSGAPLGNAFRTKKLGQSGADAKHAENRAMKADAFAWCDANLKKGSVMSQGAAEIARRIAPVKYSTAYDWVREWNKLPSAGTPEGLPADGINMHSKT